MTWSPWKLEKDLECRIPFFECLREIPGDVRGEGEIRSDSSPDWQNTAFLDLPELNLVPKTGNLDASFLKIPIYGGFLAKRPVSGI
jgi:hypothetical protein